MEKKQIGPVVLKALGLVVLIVALIAIIVTGNELTAKVNLSLFVGFGISYFLFSLISNIRHISDKKVTDTTITKVYLILNVIVSVTGLLFNILYSVVNGVLNTTPLLIFIWSIISLYIVYWTFTHWKN